MSTRRSPLSTKHADLTQRLILDAAVALLEAGLVSDLSVRAVAKRADISERTMFRYFATRDALLDAVAAEVSRRLAAPPDPQTVAELLAYPRAIYRRFEESAALTVAALHSEIYHRIRTTDAQRRGAAVRALIDREAPQAAERERKLAAADIHYHVVASTWRYFRSNFGLSLEEASDCARGAIEGTLARLGIALP